MNRRAAFVPLLALLALTSPVLVVSTGAAAGPCASATIRGTADADTLTGTAGPDVIDGLGGNDVITGLGGDDVLCGGSGADELDGGDGNDRLHGQTDERRVEDDDYYLFYGDTLAGGPGDDLLEPGDDGRTEDSDDVLSFVASTSGVVLDLPAGTATGEGSDTVVGEVQRVLGSDHDDVLVGTDEDQELYGYRGSDHLDGGGGDDYLDGASSYERDTGELAETTGNVLHGGAGADNLHGSDGDDSLRGGPGRDNIDGGPGLDAVRGGAGADRCGDTVVPGEGQTVSGGPGRDEVELSFGPGGHDAFRDAVVRVDLGAGTARAVSGTTTLRARVPGFEVITATYGRRWYVRGTDGPDEIGVSRRVAIVARGLGGDDRLDGSVRDDVLDGGRGYDTADGWLGDDRYVAVEKVLD